MEPSEYAVMRPVLRQEDLLAQGGYVKPRTTLSTWARNSYANWKLLSFFKDRVPFTRWITQYSWRSDFLSDFVAGFTVAVMHIPQGMAYALLGTVSPIVGIYMAFFPVLVYSFLGTSRHNSIGTFAVVCLMTGKVVLAYSSEDGTGYTKMEVATTVAFMVGIYQLIMYLFRLGIVCTLLSDTLVNGFTTGAAIHVLTSQIKDLLGLKLSRYEGAFNVGYTWIEIFEKITSVNLAALVASSITIIVLVLNNELLKPALRKLTTIPVPIELIIVITGTLASTYGNLPQVYGMTPVGDIPTGLPLPQLPALSLIPKLAIDCITITMVAYTIAMSMALIFAQRHYYEVDSNQELFAQGASNIMGSFFSCMPITASLSRSLVQETVGGKTQLTGLISCIILLFVMLWIGPFFEPLPRCVLAGIIVVALKGMLIQAKDLPTFWKLSKPDGIVWLITFLTVVFADIDYGLFVGLGLSLASIVVQAMKPYACLLGVMPRMDIYLDCKRYKEARELPSVKIFHYAGGLNFATRNHFKNQLCKLVGINPQKELMRRNKQAKVQVPGWINNKTHNKEGIVNLSFVEHGEEDTIREQQVSYGSINEEIHCIILDFSALSYIDPSGVNILQSLQQSFEKIEISFYLAGLSGPVYDKLHKCGVSSDSLKTFPTVHDAVIFAQNNLNKGSAIRI